jgi:hypothetical protein
MLEKKGDYILTRVIFVRPEEQEVDYEGMNMKRPPPEYDYHQFRFRLEDLTAYNDVDEYNTTTVRLRDGVAYNIAVKFDKFDEFIMSLKTKKWYQIV